MTTVPTNMRAAIERPQMTAALIWLLELELDRGSETVPPVIVRFANYRTSIQWPLGDPDTTTWYPMPFSHSGFARDGEGNVQTVDVVLPNVGNILLPYLFASNGLEGNAARIYRVAEDGLSIAYPDQEAFPIAGIPLRVLSSAAKASAVTIHLGDANLREVTTPADRYNPRRCRNKFGDPATCGYVINAFAAYTSCSKLLPACVRRSLDMASRGLPGVLPGNFAAHPGISTQRR